MFMSRGTREPPRAGPQDAQGSWLAGRMLSVVMLVLTLVPTVVLTTMVIGAAADPDRDRHGYVQIFGLIFLVPLVPALLLTIVSTILLLRRKRAGFIVLAVAGCPFAFALITLTGYGIALGLVGVGVIAGAVIGFVVTGRPPTG